MKIYNEIRPPCFKSQGYGLANTSPAMLDYYKSLGTDTLEKINFILNIEEILKEFMWIGN